MGTNEEITMSKPKWVVKAEYTTRKDMEEMCKRGGEDPEDYGIDDFQEIEIAVLRENEELGGESYGWNSMDKIILFGDSSFNPEPTEKDIEWCEEVAKTICEALNKKGL
jgi:hypothetical protein